MINPEEEQKVYMTEQQAGDFFDTIQPTLEQSGIPGISVNKTDWNYLYDEDDDDKVIGFIDAITDTKQIDVFTISNDQYSLHMWDNDYHLCELILAKDGSLKQLLK